MQGGREPRNDGRETQQYFNRVARLVTILGSDEQEHASAWGVLVQAGADDDGGVTGDDGAGVATRASP